MNLSGLSTPTPLKYRQLISVKNCKNPETSFKTTSFLILILFPSVKPPLSSALTLTHNFVSTITSEVSKQWLQKLFLAFNVSDLLPLKQRNISILPSSFLFSPTALSLLNLQLTLTYYHYSAYKTEHLDLSITLHGTISLQHNLFIFLLTVPLLTSSGTTD